VPAAVAPAPAAGNAEATVVAEVGAVLQAWRERWQEGDVDGYLRMYEPAFSGDAGSRAAWEQQRRQKMKNVRPSIRVEKLEALRVTPQEVELRFVQVYAARQHRDRGLKTMVFRRTPQGWLIADERWTRAS
jgi:ketosteroid isomerase-like protein